MEKKSEIETDESGAVPTATQQGKAWGKPAFLEKLAESLGRVVTSGKRGRPKKIQNKGI